MNLFANFLLMIFSPILLVFYWINEFKDMDRKLTHYEENIALEPLDF